METENKTSHRYFILNKPYNMVSQFVSPDPVALLGNIQYDFPPGTHAIGRLDNRSEGLLILTTNKRVTKLLFQSALPHTRTYLVQVQGEMSLATAAKLAAGVSIRIRTGVMYQTAPCEVRLIAEPGYSFSPPELAAPYHPYSWISIGLQEGKYHQVRKMVASVGHKCQRLIRTSIENLQLGNLEPGCVREVEEEKFFKDLFITNWNLGPSEI